MTWMISLAIMLCILLVAGVFAMAVNGRQQQRARALSVITRDKSGATREDNKDKQLARQRADIARKLKDAGKEQEKKKDKETLRDMMQQAGIEAPVSRFWIWSAVFAVVVWFFLNFVMSFGGLTARIRDEFVTDDAEIVLRPEESMGTPRPWHRGRVVLMGDAVHAITPHLGQGAAQAIEDGIVLAEELAQDTHDLDTAFLAYTDRRYDRCKLVVDTSLAIGEWEMGRLPGFDNVAATNHVLEVMARPL